MYLKFYRLKSKPFELAQDPGYFFGSSRHKRAMTMLEYGIENQADICVISGEIGAGKTMLIQTLLRRMRRSVMPGVISNTHGSFGDLLDWVLRAFRIELRGVASASDKYAALEKYLLAQNRRRRRTLLIVDEAQNLSVEQLEAVRVLSNINAQHGKQILQLVLVGQPELRALLQRPELTQLAQRVAVDFHLSPMDVSDVASYIDHRIRIAGGRRQLFTADAISAIHQASRGVPRVVNILCDLALVYGYAEEKPTIDRQIVEEVVRDKQEGGLLGAGLQGTDGRAGGADPTDSVPEPDPANPPPGTNRGWW